MKNLLLFIIAVFTLHSCSSDSEILPTEEDLRNQDLLEELIKITEENSINRLDIDWPALKTEVRAKLESTSYESAVFTLLGGLGDNHSFYQYEAGGGIRNSSISCDIKFEFPFINQSGIGYIKIDGFGGSQAEALEFATNIQDNIKLQDSEELSGWIVDLSSNTGGNMYPMIAGLGPLLGEMDLGHFIDPVGNSSPWGYVNGSSYAGRSASRITTVSDPYTLISSDTKVAVVISSRTASSGEAAAISFIGSDNVRFFGTPSCGLSTANAQYNLSNGDLIFLTVSTMADRNKNLYGGKIEPDFISSDISDLQVAITDWMME